MPKRVQWGCPTKYLEKAKRKLKRDLRFYGGEGLGDCAKLDERHPEIVLKQHKDGTTWYHTEVDNIILDLELG